VCHGSAQRRQQQGLRKRAIDERIGRKNIKTVMIYIPLSPIEKEGAFVNCGYDIRS
jgi:hypothetical protein